MTNNTTSTSIGKDPLVQKETNSGITNKSFDVFKDKYPTKRAGGKLVNYVRK